MSATIGTERGDGIRITTEARHVLLTIADHREAVAVTLTPAEAEKLSRLLAAEAYVAEHG